VSDTPKVYVVKVARLSTFQLRYVDPMTGRWRCKSTDVPVSSLKRDRDAAVRLAGELERQLEGGATSIPSKVTWAAYRERYEGEAVPGLAKETGNKIRMVLDRVERVLSPRLLSGVNEAKLSHLSKTLRSDGLSESTIHSYMAQLKAALNWAVRQKLLRALPSFPKVQRRKKVRGTTPMRGRPITAEEFERMLGSTFVEVGAKSVEAWRHYLRGLWTSGLRLSESLELSWDEGPHIHVVLARAGRRVVPRLRIPAESEKGNTERLLPVAPEFAMLLLSTPEADRVGRVFKLPGLRGSAEVRAKWVGKIVSRIGRKAGVVVRRDLDLVAVKYASAHDLRRAFGERWAARIMPAQLMELMRHESIETTLRYYVGTNAARTEADVWRAFEKSQAAAAGPSDQGEGDGAAGHGQASHGHRNRG
jgi:integrase